jgi:hypothetical protein
VVALTEYADGVGTNARVTERYAYTPYGEFVVLKGDAGSGELGAVGTTSAVGNVFFHQGLPLDQEKSSYQNRWREYGARMQRFAQRDPLAGPGSAPWRQRHAPAVATCAHDGCAADEKARESVIEAGAEFRDGMTLHEYERSCPLHYLDPEGSSTWCGTTSCACDTGSSGVATYGDSERARLIVPGGRGCVTLLAPPGIYCTGSCSEIKSWKAADNGNVPILDHECCHWCDYKDHGFCKYLLGIWPDTCSSRPKTATPMWGDPPG